MKKEFKINTGEREVFRKYVELIRPFLKGLRPREADVFAEILYRHYLKRDIANQRDRMALVFNSESREEIAEYLELSQPVLRNAVSSLRKKNILREGNIIPDVYLLDISEGILDLSFIFTVKK